MRSGKGNLLDFLDWRNLLSYMSGVAVELMGILAVAGIGLLAVIACRLLL